MGRWTNDEDGPVTVGDLRTGIVQNHVDLHGVKTHYNGP